jgi:permuted papain-like amidase YaeF/Yiix C92 family enzyme
VPDLLDDGVGQTMVSVDTNVEWFHLRALGLIGNMKTLARFLGHARTRLIGALVLNLARPIKHSSPHPSADPQSLASVLNPGDVLLSHGNTRVAALIKCITRSPWSHVSIYAGPLEDGPDPLCIVEADVAAGVRSIRLSELNALQVRVLRPIGLSDTDRCRLADWVVSRIGSEYDLAHAWGLGRNLLRLPLPLPLPRRLRSPQCTVAYGATRFICCSLLANAFALVGYPILPDQMRIGLAAAVDHSNLTPGDFERASLFEVVSPGADASL